MCSGKQWFVLIGSVVHIAQRPLAALCPKIQVRPLHRFMTRLPVHMDPLQQSPWPWLSLVF
jgi:hypothetical protein